MSGSASAENHLPPPKNPARSSFRYPEIAPDASSASRRDLEPGHPITHALIEMACGLEGGFVGAAADVRARVVYLLYEIDYLVSQTISEIERRALGALAFNLLLNQGQVPGDLVELTASARARRTALQTRLNPGIKLTEPAAENPVPLKVWLGESSIGRAMRLEFQIDHCVRVAAHQLGEEPRETGRKSVEAMREPEKEALSAYRGSAWNFHTSNLCQALGTTWPWPLVADNLDASWYSKIPSDKYESAARHYSSLNSTGDLSLESRLQSASELLKILPKPADWGAGTAYPSRSRFRTCLQLANGEIPDCGSEDARTFLSDLATLNLEPEHRAHQRRLARAYLNQVLPARVAARLPDDPRLATALHDYAARSRVDAYYQNAGTYAMHQYREAMEDLAVLIPPELIPDLNQQNRWPVLIEQYSILRPVVEKGYVLPDFKRLLEGPLAKRTDIPVVHHLRLDLESAFGLEAVDRVMELAPPTERQNVPPFTINRTVLLQLLADPAMRLRVSPATLREYTSLSTRKQN